MIKHKNKLISVSLATIMLVAMVATVSLSASAAPTKTVKAPVGSAAALWNAGGGNIGGAVVSGTMTDGTVYCTINPVAWTSIGKPGFVTIAGDPAATTDGLGNVYFFVKGSDSCIYYSKQPVGGPFAANPWTKLGTITVAAGTSPSAYSLPAPSGVNVLYVDPTTNALMNVNLNTGTTTNLGGYVSATPGAAVNGNRADVFVRGQSGASWQSTFVTGGWTGWTAVPGYDYLAPGTGPAVTWNPLGAPGKPSLDVWVEGGSGSLWYQHFDVNTGQWNPSPPGSATGWKLVGGVLTGTPAAACAGADDITVAVKGGDNNPYWTSTQTIAYIGPPVPPATTSAGWTLQAWQGPLTNVP